MKRFAMDKLVEWKNSSNRKPMLVMGARQVGKTWLMKEFGKVHYSNTAYISFYNNKRAAEIFKADYDIKRLIMNLSIEARTEIEPETTLVVFDEIQEAPNVLESLKYFCEEATEYHIIAAGSLLGVALHSGVSYPVGKVDILDLYPLSYREFLYAMDEPKLAELLLTKDYSMIDVFADKYLFYLKNYYYVGGMPAIVDYFREHKNYEAVRQMQNSILRQYKGDFGKHVTARELPRINMVWDGIPIQLAKENKKFFFGQIKKGARSSDFEMAIQWLLDCGLIHKVYRVNEPNVPLSAYKNFSAYKLFTVDIGLLGAMSELDAMSILEGNEIFVEFKGALTEQYVLQQIISDTQYTPYYFGTEKAAFEQDFMIQAGKNVIPIEVKAEGNIHSASLKSFCDKYHPKKAVRFSTRKYIHQEWFENIPLYAVCNLGC